jgi:signal transduction histidine kinase/HAMP domain-containing protein
VTGSSRGTGEAGGAARGAAGAREADRVRRARIGSGPGFRARLTLGLVVAAVLPVAAFGVVVLLLAGLDPATDDVLARGLLLAIAISVVFGVVLAAILASSLAGSLRALARSVDLVSSGDADEGLELPGDDEISRLAESQNRLARDLARRNRELRTLVDALQAITPDEPPGSIARRAAADARAAFGMIECEVLLVDPREIPEEELVPGEAVPVRADLRVAGAHLGVITGHLPATRRWERADQDLLDLFALEVAGAVRNAQLYARVEAQNRRLVQLDEAKDDFLRGVSHNLQTPLASIRGYAQQLATERPDRRLDIVTEQADRLSRMVRQLLTVSRIESGALRSRLEVFAAVPRVRRTWEALGATEVPFALEDRSEGWLALGDPDQLDQVLWALLDNAVGYGGRTPVEAVVALEAETKDLLITITDHGPGVADEDRERLFGRFQRGAGRPSGEGSGLGLYASRALCRAMGGDLELEPAAPDRGASFTVRLPAEAPDET